MRKGEKLYNFLMNKMHEMTEQEHHKSMSPSAIDSEECHNTLYYLEGMSDEEFNRIIFDAPDGDYIDGYKIGAGT